MALSPGTPAPNFTLLATPDQSLSLSEIGGPVVLIFYPADWSPVCGDELTMFEAASQLFQKHDAQLIGISVDGAWSHTAFRAEHKIEFPLLADFHPKGATARAYDVYDDKDGICERALFVIDRGKKIAWSYVSPVGVSPGADGALNAVEALS
ncbi:MAG: redoxin domain-containing protein [Acidimicrobiales bacterium]